MQEQRLKYLFGLYIQKKASNLEEAELLDYVERSENRKLVEDMLEHYWLEFSPQENPFSQDQANTIFNAAITPAQNSKIRKLRFYKICKYAAAIAVVVMSGILSFYIFHKNPIKERIAKITPGHAGATLQLGDGRRINLDEISAGLVDSDDGISISKTPDGSIVYVLKGVKGNENDLNTLSTDKGQTYQVQLPDGSRVWLNAQSSITYPVNFEGKMQREVTLKGEGYFEVAKNPAHPFIVKSNAQRVEVLGTHFNVHAYPDEDQISTTLLEGAVRLNGLTYLKPGQKAIYKNSQFSLSIADIAAETAWKDGRFSFSGKDFQEVMKTIARWYDVEIVYDYKPEHLRIAGGISRYENIEEVLGILQDTGEIRFKIEGRRVHVLK
jgi:transmembrane sensor